MGPMLTRRWFFQALAASVVAAGMPLPVGFPREAAAYPVDGYYIGRTLIFTSGSWKGTVREIADYAGGVATFRDGLSVPIGACKQGSYAHQAIPGARLTQGDTFLIL